MMRFALGAKCGWRITDTCGPEVNVADDAARDSLTSDPSASEPSARRDCSRKWRRFSVCAIFIWSIFLLRIRCAESDRQFVDTASSRFKSTLAIAAWAARSETSSDLSRGDSPCETNSSAAVGDCLKLA